MNFDDTYRKKMLSMDENAPEEVWEEISNQLDIDEVWARLENTLENQEAVNPLIINFYKKNKRSLNAVATIAAALLIFFLSLPWLRNHNQQSSPEQIENRQNVVSKNIISEKHDNEISKHQRAINLKEADNKRNYIAESQTEKDIFHEKHVLLNKIESGQNPKLNTEVTEELNKNTSLKNSTHLFHNQSSKKGFVQKKNNTKSQQLASVNNIDHKNRRHKLSIGIISGINNTWLLNYETLNGLQPSSLTNTLPTYGTELGLSFGIRNNASSEFRGEAYFHSETSQQYKEYINARYVTRKIDLHYLKFQMYYTKNVPLFRPLLNSGVIAGIYFSYLNNGIETIGGNASSITRDFTSWDYGLVTGYENAILINNDLTLKPGFRISYSFHNIFKGNQLIPSSFNKTNPLSMGFYLGIDYKF